MAGTLADHDRQTSVSAATRVAAVVATDDRPLLRAGLRAVLSDDDRVDLVAECSVDRLVQAVEQHGPAVVVATLRANDPDPFRAIATAKALSPETHVLVIADGASVIDLREAVIAGVDSFLLTTASEDDIRDAVSTTAAGERVVSPEVAMQLAGTWKQEREEAPASALTARELEVLQLLAEGLTNQEVAKRLGLSARTVKTHVQNLLAKLDVPDRTGAVARGFRLSLIS